MLFQTLVNVLKEYPETILRMQLPDGTFVPAHFHVTEVGKVQKDFIDCGGTQRSKASCVLQLWVASDEHHRLHSTKLARIMELGEKAFQLHDLPVEVEYETHTVSQYPIYAAEMTSSGLLIQLGSKHTACLALDVCGVSETNDSCCETPGCC